MVTENSNIKVKLKVDETMDIYSCRNDTIVSKTFRLLMKKKLVI